MSNLSGFGSQVNAIHAGRQLPAELPRSAFAGVRTRRMLAVAIDFAILATLITAAALLLALPTLGLSLFLIIPAFPFIAFFYNGFSVSGRNMGTPGMRIMDLEMGLTNGTRVPFLHAAIHAVLFYLSWSFPPVFLVSLLANDKRCLHDMLADIIVTRRTF